MPGRKNYSKTVFLLMVVTANRTVNVLVLWGVVIIEHIHNFDETWMSLWDCGTKKIKSGRKNRKY